MHQSKETRSLECTNLRQGRLRSYFYKDLNRCI